MSAHTARHLLCLCLLAFFAICTAHAQERMYQPRSLPASAWQVLEAARGITVNGKPGTQASVQVVFDAHCPYCARLYERLERDYPDLAVRWVPIAYFKRDSEKVAAAILATDDPAMALDRNFREYNFKVKRGGFRAPPYRDYHLDDEHKALAWRWAEWGGYTPMIIVKTADGSILKAMGSTEAFLDHVLEQAAPIRNGE